MGQVQGCTCFSSQAQQKIADGFDYLKEKTVELAKALKELIQKVIRAIRSCFTSLAPAKKSAEKPVKKIEQLPSQDPSETIPTPAVKKRVREESVGGRKTLLQDSYFNPRE